MSHGGDTQVIESGRKRRMGAPPRGVREAFEAQFHGAVRVRTGEEVKRREPARLVKDLARTCAISELSRAGISAC